VRRDCHLPRALPNGLARRNLVERQQKKDQQQGTQHPTHWFLPLA
jgi:hypothetical protein